MKLRLVEIVEVSPPAMISDDGEWITVPATCEEIKVKVRPTNTVVETTNLLSRLQSAPGPNRELDAEVCPYPTKRNEGGDWLYEMPGHSGRAWDYVPRYTESIDAMVTLVPEGMYWDAGHNLVGFYGCVWADADGGGEYQAYGSTPAIALRIAIELAKEDSKP